jgi:hypothetical protein
MCLEMARYDLSERISRRQKEVALASIRHASGNNQEEPQSLRECRGKAVMDVGAKQSIFAILTAEIGVGIAHAFEPAKSTCTRGAEGT